MKPITLKDYESGTKIPEDFYKRVDVAVLPWPVCQHIFYFEGVKTGVRLSYEFEDILE